MAFEKEANLLKVTQIFKQRESFVRDEKDKFQQLLLILNQNQQDLIIDLLDRFKRIKSENDIFGAIRITFEEILKKPSLGVHFVIYPLKKKGETGKGSDRLFTELQALKSYLGLPEFNIKMYNHIDKFERIPQNSKIILIDDYVGSGQTVIDSVNSFLQEIDELGWSSKIDMSRIVIVCLYGQKNGVDMLRKLGYNLVVGHLLNKGISDYYVGSEKHKAIEVMSSIENMMNGMGKLNSNYNFGRKKSEGLISFKRCPNNTFPVFWLNEEYKKGSKRPFTFIR